MTIIIIIIIYLLTAIGLSPGGSGYFMCKQNMKLVTAEFNPLSAELNPICHLLALLGAHHILHVSRIRAKSGGLHEKHVVATWNVGNRLSIC